MRVGLRVVSLCVISITLFRYLALPACLHYFIETRISEVANYDCTFSDIDINIIEGEYTLQNFLLTRKGRTDRPFIAADRVSFGVAFDDLMQGSMTGNIRIDNPIVCYVSGSKTAAPVKDREWQKVFTKLLFIPLNKLTIFNGSVFFENHATAPAQTLNITGINLLAKDICCTNSYGGSLPAFASASAQAYGARVNLKMRFDPNVPDTEFDLRTEVRDLDLQSVPPYFLADRNLQTAVDNGILSLYIHASYSDSKIKGYVKPLLESVSIVKYKEDCADHACEVLASAPFSMPQQRISFETLVEYNTASLWSTVAFTLRNAFIQGIKPIVKSTAPQAPLKRKAPRRWKTENAAEAKQSSV